MAQIIISFPFFLILSVLQSVAFSRITFLAGSADIVMLAIIAWLVIDDDGNYIIWAIIGGFFTSILSAFPLIVPILAYLLAALISKMVHRLLWQSPVLTIFISTVISTILKFFLEFIALKFLDIPSPFLLSLGSILMPCIILNLFLIFPVFVIMTDLIRIISPKEDKYVA